MDIYALSDFFLALITLIVGSTALVVYKQQKRDHKRDAANIILLEIKSAERRINSIRSEKSEDLQNTLLLENESWSKYKYLFVKSFDRDEWDSINDFYSKCKAYDEATSSSRLSFSKNEEQIRINAHRIFADYIKDVIEEIAKTEANDDSKTMVEVAKLKAEVFNRFYLDNDDDFIKPLYTPQKYTDDKDKYLRVINISLSAGSVGTKLKRIARIKP